ncbi:Protein F29B9.11 [Aphelenchoides avenae]|nr:Protein F29B9.11 [Aphelenchus avenae]KAH7720099.1 Protein F29B9.11 [Aphelenchus avenae]
MIGRSLLQLGRQANRQILAVRKVHKGHEVNPPMRWLSVPQRVGVYLFIATFFLSYPTYVLLNLDNIRPRGDNSLSPEVEAEIEARRAARAGRKSG